MLEGASKVVCRKCGNPVSSDEATCPNCGAELNPSADSLEDKSKGLRKMSRELKAIDTEGQEFEPDDVVADRFEIEEYVGDGTFGEVYRARDRLVEMSVALKLFDEDLIRTPPEREDFVRATEAARSMTQENVVRIHDSGVDGERPWVSMQYLEGLTLRKILDMREKKGERFELDEIEPIVGDITLAIQHVEREYPVGTLEPENIFVLPDLVKITDGYLWEAFPSELVAERLEASPYLAPELRENRDDVDIRCDVYSLGRIIGEMIFGPDYEPGAHDDDDDSEARAIDELCSRATADDPSERYPSVEALSEDFLTLVDTGQLLDETAAMDVSIPPVAPDEGAERAGPEEKTAVVAREDAPVPDEPEGDRVDELPDDELATEEYERDDRSPSSETPAPPAEEPVVTEEYERDERSPSSEEPVPSSEEPAPPPDDPPESPPDELSATQEYERDRESSSQPAAEEFPDDEPTTTDEPSAVEQLPDDEPMTTDEYDRDSAQHSEFNPEVFPDQEGEREDVSLPDPDYEPAGDASESTSSDSSPDDPDLPDLDTPSEDESSGSDEQRTRAQDEPTPTEAPEPKTVGEAREESSGSDSHVKIVAAAAVILVLAAGVWGIASLSSSGSDANRTIEIAEESSDAGAGWSDTSSGSKQASVDAGPSDELLAALSTGHDHRAEATRAARDQAESRAEELESEESSESSGAGGSGASGADREATGARASGGGGGRAAAEPEKTECPDGMLLVERDSGNFCIDQFEHPGSGSRPMVDATWFQAQSTCESQGKRLCTLAEWKRACGWRKYPYGDQWNPEACNTQNEMGFSRSLAATGKFKECRSWSGAYDMTGNVHEWVKEQQIAGGGFDSGRDVASCDYASPKDPGSSARTIGFRCCADPKAK
jgi:serine/threonine protein kinase